MSTSTLNLLSTPKAQIMDNKDPKVIKDLEDQLWLLEEEMDTLHIDSRGDATRFFNLVKEHSDIEDVLQTLLDDEGHDLK